MKNSINLITILLSVILIIMSITACSNTTVGANKNEATSSVTSTSTTKAVETSEKETTTASESATQKIEVSDTTTTRPADQKSAGQTTTKKVTTTQKQTTTRKHTTTTKDTTTQKSTTTKDEWDCNVDGHSCNVGPIGWVNSFDVATDKALEYIAAKDASGNFRVKQCHNCGKYTAEITLR